MKLTIEATSKIVQLNGIPARIWEGKAEDGTECLVFVTRVSVHERYGPSIQAQFQRALQETKTPSAEVQAIPLRMIL